MIQEALTTLLEGRSLTRAQAREVMDEIMAGGTIAGIASREGKGEHACRRARDADGAVVAGALLNGEREFIRIPELERQRSRFDPGGVRFRFEERAVHLLPGCLCGSALHHRDTDHQACGKRQLPCIPILGHVVRELSNYLNEEATGHTGAQYELSEDYFARIDAINPGFLHELLDTSRGIWGVAPGGKQRPRRAIPEIGPEFVRQFREQRDTAILSRGRLARTR